MENLKLYDSVQHNLRESVSAGKEDDGFAAIRHEDDATGQIDALCLYAWGESARVINRVLKLEPSSSTSPVRDVHSANAKNPTDEPSPVERQKHESEKE